ncbi:MAG: formylglycine-generating enzyme family protein, partial [Planctomycetota bacterium]
MSLALGALTFLVLCPAAAQTAFIQEPGAATNGNHAAASDIREIQRSTTGVNPGEVPPGMVLVPAGKVVIGTPVDEVEKLGQRDVIQMTEILAETPRHEVEVGAFMIDVTEVTNQQWKVFLEATGRDPSSILVEYGWPGGDIPPGQEDFPVTNVNIPEIRQYLSWCGKRLPTEEEWTRAARGDDERTYPWGDKWN